MNFFNNGNDKFVNKTPSSHDELKEREAIKKSMAVNLSNIGFTKNEVDSVISIITDSEKEVNVLKEKLANLQKLNIPDSELSGAFKEIFEEIRKIQQKSAVDVKDKITEIQLMKQKQI